MSEEDRREAAHSLQLMHYNGLITWREALDVYAEHMALAEYDRITADIAAIKAEDDDG